MRGTSLEALIAAALAAPPVRREAALRVLTGELTAVEPGSAVTHSEPYLNRSNLARQLDVSPWTVWRWNPPSHEIGGRPRFLLSEVQDYLRSSEFQRRLASLRTERRERSPERGMTSTHHVAPAAIDPSATVVNADAPRA